MPRSTNAVPRKARKKRVLKFAKGYFGRRKNVWTITKNAVEKAWQYAYIHRKQKKRNFRSLWIVRINAALRQQDSSYSVFMHQLKEKKVALNRKALADLAMNHSDTFAQLVKQVSQ